LRAPLESIQDSNEPLIRLSPRVLNDAIGSIFLPQHISLFHGRERAPLTIFAHAVIASAARIENAYCVYLDSGTNYRPSLIRSLSDSHTESAEILRKVIVGQVLSLDDVMEKITLLERMGAVSLIVLDSLTGALNLTAAPGSRGRQRNLFRTMDAIRRIINRLNAHFMITDHSSQNWTSGVSTPIGGNVVSHAVDSVILIDRLRPHDDLTRILIERSTLPTISPGAIIRVGLKGIRSIR
jgi:RecA/RadA recombinase